LGSRNPKCLQNNSRNPTALPNPPYLTKPNLTIHSLVKGTWGITIKENVGVRGIFSAKFLFRFVKNHKSWSKNRTFSKNLEDIWRNQKYFCGTQVEKHCFRNSEFVSSIWIESFETEDSWSWIEQLVMSDQCNLFKLRWIYMTTIYKKYWQLLHFSDNQLDDFLSKNFKHYVP
jgi:hypothetical protein